MALFVQIQKIHIAKNELGMSKDDYLQFLSNWDVTTSKDLTVAEADEALIRLEEQGWVPKPAKKKSNYDQYTNRSSEFAAPSQLKLAEILWKIVARNPSDQARDKFIFRQTKIRKLEWLKKPHIEAVLCALEDMYRKLSVEDIARRTDKLIPKDQQFLKENLVRIKEVRYAK